MSIFAALIKRRKKKSHRGKSVMSWRKCPFCSTINKGSNLKCRDCGLKYPFELAKTKKENLSRFNITLKDPRFDWEIKIENLLGIAVLFAIAIPYVIKYFFGKYGYFNLDNLDVLAKLLPSLLPVGFAFLFATKSRNHAEHECKSCKQVMVIRVSRTRNYFPGAIECWNCGAIHSIDWIDKKPKKRQIPGLKQASR